MTAPNPEPLYRYTVLCRPPVERAVIDACPDGVAVRASTLIPDDGHVYVIDNDLADALLQPQPGWIFGSERAS